MASLSLKQVHKSYGNVAALQDINLEVHDGEFMVFVGPSGCGKSTLLRCIAGLEELTAGELCIDGECMNEVPPASRGLSMVFQNYALYPLMTVEENLTFGMRLTGAGKQMRTQRAAEVAQSLQITPLLQRLPGQLSGGQRQRVAIGRSIMRSPRVYLFDEPLSNLDASLRVQMRMELTRLHQRLATTMLYVTHDQVEAMTMADRIVVFNGGHIEQVGTPMDLYREPANVFVATFLGSPRINLLPADVFAQMAHVLPQGCTQVGIRPENLHVNLADGSMPVSQTPNGLRLRATVQLIDLLGDVMHVHLTCEESNLPLTASLHTDQALQPGDAVTLSAARGRAIFFDAQQRRISVECPLC